MEVIIFLYNVALLLLFCAGLIYSFIIYRQKKLPFCLYLQILFLFYIFDNTVIYMTEFLKDFSMEYDTSFMSVPAFKTVMVIVTAFCLISIHKQIFKKTLSVLDYSLLILLGLWELFIPMLPDSAFMVWFYYFPYQLFTFYISVNGLYTIKKDTKITEAIPFLKHYKKMLLCMLLFSFLITLEDTIVIFNFDIYTNLVVKINNKSITEDILRILYSIFFIHSLSELLKRDASKTLPLPGAADSLLPERDTVYSPENECFYQFSKKYNLTIREQDIFKYLIEDKNNQEVSDSLFISIGTVKTHVHNIFQKVNVTKRHQLIEIYKDFCIKSTHS